MNPARRRAIEEGLNGQASKVYEHLPIESSVTLTEMMSILGAAKLQPPRNVVEACLHTLVERGLAKETSFGRFRRLPAHEDSEKPAIGPALAIISSAPAPVVSPPQPVTPFDELAALEGRIAASLGTVAALSRELTQLREAVAQSALSVEAYVQSIRKEQEKYQALKAMLRDVAL